MATITLRGKPVHTSGELPAIGAQAPGFTLTRTDLNDATLGDFAGGAVVLNIFPSLDTPTCAMSVRRFNAEVDRLGGASVLCISADLPFAQKRFCGAEGLDRVVTLSDMRHKEFGDSYGLRITDGPLAGLLARAVVVIDPQGSVHYTQLVQEVSDEPDYDAAIAAVKALSPS